MKAYKLICSITLKTKCTKMFVTFLILVILNASAAAFSDLPENLIKYESVQPLQITSHNNKRLYRRDLSTLDLIQEGLHKPRVEYLIKLKDKTFHLDAQQNSYLLAHKFNVKLQSEPTNAKLHNCNYQGNLKNRRGSVVLSTCDGLTGTIFDDEDGTQYFLRYLPGSKKHIVYRPEDMESTPNIKYEMNNILGNTSTDRTRFRRHLRKDQDISLTKYVSFAMVADHALFKRRNSDVQQTINFLLAIANHVDNVFRKANIRVALTNIEIWNKKDMFNVSTNLGDSLSLFKIYNRDVLGKLYKWKHDNAHMLTGIKRSGSLVGLAATGTLCLGFSEAISHAWSDNAALTAGTVAHEFGHNFGIYHYEAKCKCVQPPCLMASYASWSAVKSLTDCTINAIHSRCMASYCACLIDEPSKIYGGPACGNGYVEENEECDCGRPMYCKNPCCNPVTCKLRPWVQCAHGQCCEKCKIKPKGSVCRASVGECDIDDQCDGNNAECPENAYHEDYTSCNADQGYCHKSMCSDSLDDQCVHMWGPGAKSGGEKCQIGKRYINTDGTKWGHCGQNEDLSFIKCTERDVHCGKVQCYGDGLPNFILYGYTRATMFYNGNEKKCRTGVTHLGNDLTDPTVAMPGTRCGLMKVCHDRKCIDTSLLRRVISKCHNICGKFGRCTNLGRCYCNTGYKCPNCVGLDASNVAGKVCDYPVAMLTSSKVKLDKSCFCKNGGLCTSNGMCVCKPGYKCPDCLNKDSNSKRATICDSIPKLYFTPNQCKIKCEKGGMCNPLTNTCYCPAGLKCPDCKEEDRKNTNGRLCFIKQLGSQNNFVDIKCGAAFNGTLKKIGCKGGDVKNKFDHLITLRNSIVWQTEGYNLPKLLCICASTAAKKGYHTAGLQFWGECWGTKSYDAAYKLSTSSDCTTYNYRTCDKTNEICAGKSSIYLYAVFS